MKRKGNLLDKELDQAVFPSMGGGIEGLPKPKKKSKKKRSKK